MNKIVSLLLLCLAVSLRLSADDKVTFTASAPDAVAVGDQFRLSYVVTTQNVRDFQVPSIKGFDVLMGPSRSSQTSMQIVNGKTTSTSSITFTYILLATTEGEFTLPGASITADGNEMVSNSVKVKVLPADDTTSGSGGAAASGRSAGSASISNSDLFVTATASKTTVYEQEALVLTYKIYTTVDLRGFDNIKLPDFKGFQSQEVEQPNNPKWGLEHYKGRNYQATVYRQFVLFPQQSGDLTIDPAQFDASIAQATHVSDPFEAFFNGGTNYVEVKKSLSTPKLTIHVKPLPSGKPSDFSGGVGDLSLSSSINATKVKTNDAVTLKLVISGTGNLKLVSTPEVKFPEDFEVYDPKTENNFRLTSAGSSGSLVIEYLAIPRTAGNYRIPPVTLSYFDIKSGQYKTLSTEEYRLEVEKGEGNAAQTIANFTSKEELRVLNEDIRFIKQNNVSLTPRGKYFFGTVGYWLWYVVPAILFIALFTVYRKQIAANANVARTRTRKANKVAVKRMKQAGKLLAAGEKGTFYDEVLKALWGYVSDKLNIPVSRLSRENVAEKLRGRGVDDALTQSFLQALDDCEFARYAPGDQSRAMDKVYDTATKVISQMENTIK
ncbi:MAG: BatD family protein [Prevotellaceae bacterium]|nr:BatD family protein [Prevotellaceae bacterium]